MLVYCAGGGRATALPGLQDVRGQWKGSWEAYGGGGGATSVEFGVRGEDWEWGDYGLDKVPPPPDHHCSTDTASAAAVQAQACRTFASLVVCQPTSRLSDTDQVILVCMAGGGGGGVPQRGGHQAARVPAQRGCAVPSR